MKGFGGAAPDEIGVFMGAHSGYGSGGMSGVRVRFAPSPTGLLHIGGARTALFNWLYARHTGGVFVLRIEDTDAARNTEEALRVILDGLRWLGLDWDEGPEAGGPHGPYFQSRRREIYDRAIAKLMAAGKAYEEDRAVKFRMPKTPCVVRDAICGDITFDRTHDADLVIRRSDGSPVFHLVNVVDDLEMRITHVIRGEDHLSNTPKHLALFEALGAAPPVYAHIPLILRSPSVEETAAHEKAMADWKARKKKGEKVGEAPKLDLKMSKRDRGASLAEYMAEGYYAPAVRNYLCLLGWSLRENREVFPIGEAVAKFDLPQVNRSNAKFDLNKLFWINGETLRALDRDAYRAYVRPILEKAGAVGVGVADADLDRVLALVQEKVKVGRELPDWVRCFFTEDYPVEEEARAKHLAPEPCRENVKRLAEAFTKAEPFGVTALEACVKELAEGTGQKVAAFVHPCRVAVSGRTVGPSLYHMLEVLGRERVVARLRRAG